MLTITLYVASQLKLIIHRKSLSTAAGKLSLISLPLTRPLVRLLSAPSAPSRQNPVSPVGPLKSLPRFQPMVCLSYILHVILMGAKSMSISHAAITNERRDCESRLIRIMLREYGLEKLEYDPRGGR